MRLIVLLPFLLGALAAGYWLGVRDRRVAVASAYADALPLLASVREVLAQDPSSAAFPAVRAVVAHELEQYELNARVR